MSETTENQDAGGGFAPAAGSAKFAVQRAEWPNWFAGWNVRGYPSWTSYYNDAQYVRLDDLSDTLVKLQKHKPVAELVLPNAKLSE